MKLHHLSIIFVIIAIASMVITDIKTNYFKLHIENKEQMDRCLDSAIDDGITRLSQVDGNNNIVISKDAAIHSFFTSLYATFGVLSDRDRKEKLSAYIPVITITMEEGYYIFYNAEVKREDDYKYLSKQWSELMPYYYEDQDFIYSFTLGDIITIYDKNNLLNTEELDRVLRLDYHDLIVKEEYADYRNKRPDSFLLNEESFELIRKKAILNCIENTMAYYTSKHNKIASQYGITYNFAMPMIHRERWAPYLDDISMFVVFQGYPFGDHLGQTYNRIASAASKVSKRKALHLQQKDWYLLYHKMNCTELLKDEIILLQEVCYSKEDAAKMGAYGCEICCPGDKHVPNLVGGK